MSRVRELITAVLKLDPEGPAVESNGRWWTWGEIDRIGQELDSLLQGRGYGRNVRVGVLLRNRAPFFAVAAALAVGERCLVTLNPVYPDEQVAGDIAEQATPVLMLSSEDLARPAIRDKAMESGALVLKLPDERGGEVTVLAEPKAGMRTLRTESVGVAIEMLTSGTTGKPKRVPLQRVQFEEGLLAAFAFEKGRSPDDSARLRDGVLIITNPLAHISGVLGVMGALLAGRKSCLIEKFSVAVVHEAVKRHRPRVLGLPPAALRMLYNADLPREDFQSIQVLRSGTAPLDPDLADAIYARYGLPVLQNYGATEFGGVAGWTLEDFKAHQKDRRGAVGRLNAGIDARVVDPESFEPLSPGETGILELRGRRIGDGQSWLRTSDLAVVDAERFLWIKGRADNAIIRGGFKVQPDKVVAALEQHPAIKEACVVGVPDARLGAVPAAAFSLWNSAETPAVQDLQTFLRARLAPYEVPVILREVMEFPRTVSLKIDQTALRNLLTDALSAVP